MKKKLLFVLAAFFMLFGTSAMAQVDSTLEGDVNEDGVVDIADITAVIAIIKQNAEANPTYYWYVGQSIPASIGAVANETTDKWTELGTDLSKVTQIDIYSAEEWGLYYVLVPTSLGFKPFTIDGSKDESVGWRSTTSTISGYTLWTKKDEDLGIITRFKK